MSVLPSCFALPSLHWKGSAIQNPMSKKIPPEFCPFPRWLGSWCAVSMLWLLHRPTQITQICPKLVWNLAEVGGSSHLLPSQGHDCMTSFKSYDLSVTVKNQLRFWRPPLPLMWTSYVNAPLSCAYLERQSALGNFFGADSPSPLPSLKPGLLRLVPRAWPGRKNCGYGYNVIYCCFLFSRKSWYCIRTRTWGIVNQFPKKIYSISFSSIALIGIRDEYDLTQILFLGGNN